ncbi:MAG: hypothetical protein MJ117_00195 [Lachnospiraceae bacterium]|nr:hypothetical protein [Lachnospiraceae bacterium]
MAAFYTISMQGGEKEKLTLNLGALAELSKKEKPLVDRYFELYKKLQKNEDFNELEMGEIFYIAYAAAHVKEDEHMEMAEFLYELTDDRTEMGRVFQQLFGAQEKKQNFQKPSRKQRRK